MKTEEEKTKLETELRNDLILVLMQYNICEELGLLSWLVADFLISQLSGLHRMMKQKKILDLAKLKEVEL